jgi:hypothetical protein
MKTASLLRGSAGQRLPLFARRLPAQVLAMGIVSRRWAKRFIIGDTAESIIREVSCDLLLIKPANFGLRLGERCVRPLRCQPRATEADECDDANNPGHSRSRRWLGLLDAGLVCSGASADD